MTDKQDSKQRDEEIAVMSLWPGREPKAWGHWMQDGPRGPLTEAIVPAQVNVGDIVRLWEVNPGHVHGYQHVILYDARVDRVIRSISASTSLGGLEVELARVEVTMYPAAVAQAVEAL